MAVRGHPRGRGARCGPASGGRREDRRDRHRRGRHSARSRRQGSGDPQHLRRERGCPRLPRPRHVRRLDRRRLGLERRGHRRVRRRREAAPDPVGSPGRLLHRCRRGRCDRPCRQPGREDHQPLDRRAPVVRAREEGARLRGRARRSRRGGRRQRVPGRQPGRVPRGAAPARRLGGPRRIRPLGRRYDQERKTRLLLQHRVVDLARCSRRERARRAVLVLDVTELAALRAARLQPGHLRLLQRHILLGPPGRGRRRARLGGEPGPEPRPGRVDPQTHRDGRRTLDGEPRLRRARRRPGSGDGAERRRDRPAAAGSFPRFGSLGERPGGHISASGRPSPPASRRSRRRDAASRCRPGGTAVGTASPGPGPRPAGESS